MSASRERVGSRIHVDVVPSEARGLQGRRAGLISRGIAGVIDYLAVFVALGAAYAGTAFVRLIWKGRDFTMPSPSFSRVVLLAFLLLVAYLTVMWATAGRTFGGRLIGLRVIDRHGRIPGVGVAVVRALLYALFPFGLLWVGIGRGNRSVQDLVLRTSVIYDWHVRTSRVVLDQDGAVSNDAFGARVDVQPTIADEPDDRHPEPLPRLDGE